MSWNGRFFEDFTVGDVYEHPLGRTVLPVDNSWFTLLTQNTAPLHFDAHYASQTEWGKPLVDSTFTLALVTGQSVTDSRGNRYVFPPGEYRFPLVRPGQYRLLIEPVAPYVAPSAATPAELAPLRRPDGQPFTIAAGSYGGVITLSGIGAVRIDIPLDRPATPIVLTKTASRPEAEAGDLIQYRLVVRNPDTNTQFEPKL